MRQTDLHHFLALFWNLNVDLGSLHGHWGYPFPESRGASPSELQTTSPLLVQDPNLAPEMGNITGVIPRDTGNR